MGDDEIMVLADEISLPKAVKNVLSNALTHGTSPICVGVVDVGKIWVLDARLGPSDDVLAQIGANFERFAASKGTIAGLGVSIVNAVTEAFHGSMNIGQVDDTFRITISLPILTVKDET